MEGVPKIMGVKSTVEIDAGGRLALWIRVLVGSGSGSGSGILESLADWFSSIILAFIFWFCLIKK